LVVGTQAGVFSYFENVGDVRQPKFTARTGVLNPLFGESVGSDAAPAAADLDGDAFPDLVAGSLAGDFRVYDLPEPAQGLALGAGIALLGWLKRWRQRVMQGGRR